MPFKILSNCVVCLLCLGSFVFSIEEKSLLDSEIVENNLQSVDSECSQVSLQASFTDSNLYFKIGTSIIYQEVSVGRRSRDLTIKKGNDFSVNLKGAPFASMTLAFASAQYTRLFYKESFKERTYYKYSGVGLEIGVVMGEGTRPIPIPNPRLVWGREYPSSRFSELSFNVLPAVLTTLFAASIIHDNHKCSGIEYGIGIISICSILQYSFGF